MTSIPPSLSFDSRTEWLRGEGRASDVVMSSRIRLARNLAGCPFPHRGTRVHRQASLQLCKKAILAGNLSPRLIWVDLHDASPLERMLLVERHLISKHHSKSRPSAGPPAAGPDDPRGVAISLPDERVSIMVNEEDHLRIQVIRTGLALSECWKEIDEVDNRLEAALPYAYCPRFGYLTSCPTNVGTGLRMSVMLHLPGLRLTGDIERVKRAAGDMNLAVRGFYGEGSEAAGDFYQLSNQTTLGKSERQVLEELEAQIIPKVVEYERVARRTIATKRLAAVEDQVYRALGILTQARLISAEEAMQLLSHLRLGVVLGIIKQIDQSLVNHLMLLVQPAHLQRVLGREMDQDQRRIARGDLLRTKLAR
ncbi:MAG: protein arginine kinase [Phycisphaerales bacterium]|nr:protein arginine kinase [Phycisphaerales bacterium]